MPRTDLPTTRLAANGAVPNPAGVAAATDGHRVVASVGWPARSLPENTLLRVTVANAATAVTVKAGDKAPALEAQDVTVTLPVGTHLIGPFTSGKVGRRDGSLLHVDYGTPGNVSGVVALSVPHAP